MYSFLKSALMVAITVMVSIGVTTLPGRAADESKDLQSQIDKLKKQIDKLQAKLKYVHVEDTAINGVAGPHMIIEGCNLHVRDGSGDSNGTTGLGNLIIGYDEAPDIVATSRGGTHNLVVGPGNNFSAIDGVVFGTQNSATGSYATVTGGINNTASGDYSNVTGGNVNTASGDEATVSGGTSNEAYGDRSSVSGGYLNIAHGTNSSILGGGGNLASGFEASITGGTSNQAESDVSCISGGRGNHTLGSNASISGGFQRATSGQDDWAAGGLFQDN